MGNLRRRDLPDGYFHVTARGVHGSNIFLVDLDRLDFIHLLGRVAARFDVRVFGRCLMDTHYHLVVEAVTSRLSEAMQQLNSTYAHRFNKRHARRGHGFAERFSSWVIRDEEHSEAAPCSTWSTTRRKQVHAPGGTPAGRSSTSISAHVESVVEKRTPP